MSFYLYILFELIIGEAMLAFYALIIDINFFMIIHLIRFDMIIIEM
jgi:hypothetical protein